MGPIFLNRLLSTTNPFLCKHNPENRIPLKKRSKLALYFTNNPKTLHTRMFFNYHAWEGSTEGYSKLKLNNT